MKFTVNVKDLGNVIKEITTKVANDVIHGASESLDNGVREGLRSIKVTGQTAKSYTTVNQGSTEKVVVGTINSGLGAWGLERGINDPFMNARYPNIGSGRGVFVSFAQEPHLRSWAQKKNIMGWDVSTMTGVRIGMAKSTWFGKKPWFRRTAVPIAKQLLDRNIRKRLKQ